MKLACSILAFANKATLLEDTRIQSIETTRKIADEGHVSHASDSRIDTMLSIVDMTKVSGAFTDEHIIQHIVESINNYPNIQKYIYGSPLTRKKDMTPSEFIQALREIDRRINRKVTFYIEQLQMGPKFLRSFDQIAKLCDLCKFTHLTCKPLFDVGDAIIANQFPTAEEILAHTDRIHLSADNNLIPFEKRSYSKKVRELIQQIDDTDEEITLSLEYINKCNDNESVLQFLDRYSPNVYDYCVIGAGIYGRYVSNELAKYANVISVAKDDSLEFEQSSQGTASLVNQARVHNGYHYPRSITTAMHSVKRYSKFKDEFKNSIIDNFSQVYAIPRFGSLTSPEQFEKFTNDLGIRCETFTSNLLDMHSVEKAWLTDEVAIDTHKMMQQLQFNHQFVYTLVKSIKYLKDKYKITTSKGTIYAKRIINCAYAGITQIEQMCDRAPKTNVVYEACEIALFEVPDEMKSLGFTFMDGPFVSCMPFNDKYHSLTSVLHTPHYESLETIQDAQQTHSQKDVMLQQLSHYLNKELVSRFKYVKSLYVVKTIPVNASVDDNRLVQINQNKQKDFTTILSGKLNAIYDCDEWIKEEMERFNNDSKIC